MRIPLIAGNWKMYKLIAEAVATVEELKKLVADVKGVEIVVCPVFTSLYAVSKALAGSNIAVGGQNCYLKENGAFTGEVSPQMLMDAGCTWTILGHSERRQYFNETDDFLNQKLHFALASGLKVMFCIGETLEERQSGKMHEVLTRQVLKGLAGLKEEQFSRLAIAYEPVWAIGTGVTATPAQAEEAHAYVRGLVEKEFGSAVASALRIQYGGSVKPDNAAELLKQPNVDGALVGGASLKADSFAAIVRAAL
ncbi:MAG TPA: triose-phosphate isomerase [Candidatus Hydrogenedentes bacterium]|nr:triose-phosphate isomerase [Candidatus Hydrogenedentota bacterium]HOL75815.1 triose-phosphate isomerase [Candidatus Hydrogenedentota bacterium]HPO86316.1 triose-phosphate isomerase [Candidatus Hydrogenedentota bacterium]